MKILSSLCQLTMLLHEHILIIGQHRSGKTCVIRDILSTIDACTLQKDVFVYEYSLEKKFADMIPERNLMINNAEYAYLLVRPSDKNKPIIVIDDCIYNMAFNYSSCLKYIGENTKCIISMCYPFNLNNAIKFQWLIILPCDVTALREQIYFQHVSKILEKTEFLETMDYIEKHKECLVINLTTGDHFIYSGESYIKLKRRRHHQLMCTCKPIRQTLEW